MKDFQSKVAQSTVLCDITITSPTKVEEGGDVSLSVDLEMEVERFTERVALCVLRRSPGAQCERNNLMMDFKCAFTAANWGPIFMTEVPNEYWKAEGVEGYMSPWVSVVTQWGVFKVGWRKRVIVLDWSGTTLDVPKALFESEDVTQDQTSIHCHGWDRLHQYLRSLRVVAK